MSKGLSPDTQLSHYRIVNKLGEGGMGEVYLAHDTKLERRVALKVLPDDVADTERLKRFGQEARAASALNHPNILTIYEIGEFEGTNYISTEFVDGVTLRDTLHNQSMPIGEGIDIAIQTASALAAAHEAGIIHRDIKPENIMLRSDGLVKVLDFGLAKLSENSPDSIDTEGETRAQVKTAPGVIMGTVQYMSPEQTRAKPTDARSDIWSLGCVMYEMAAGRPPFSGETSADLIAEIVRMDPEPLVRVVPEAPERLDEIISKALEKSPDERYQTVKDLLIDLRRLKKKLDAASDTERSYAPHPEADRQNSVIRPTGGEPVIPTAAVVNTTLSGKQLLATGFREHKAGALIIIGVLLVAFAGLAYAIYKFVEPSGPAPQPTMQLTRLTTDGRNGATSISPDGKYVVYSSGSEHDRSLWVRQTATGSAVQIMPPAVGTYRGTSFSPDGNHVYYTWTSSQNVRGTLFEISTLGGTPKQLLTGIEGPVTFSPDGKSMAFARGEGKLVTANIDGTNEKDIYSADPATEWISSEGPAWSPDGRVIVFGKGSSIGGLSMTLMEINSNGGEPRPVTDSHWKGEIYRTVWLKDGSALIVTASEAFSAGSQVWMVPYPTGAVRKVTNDLNGYGTFSLAVTDDGGTIVTVQEERRQQIWTAAAGDDDSRAQQVSSDRFDGDPAWTPDGQILFARNTSGQVDLWITNADGSGQRQITRDSSFDYEPAVTPDGKYIVWTSNRSGLPHIWRMNIDGSDARALTTGDTFDDGNPSITPDGKWVIYNSWRTGKWAAWRVSIDGGEPQMLLNSFAGIGAVAPDGQTVLSAYLDERDRSSAFRAALIPVSGGEPVKIFDMDIPRNFASAGTGWAADGKSIFYVSERNVYSLPVSGGKPRAVTDFKTQTLFDLALSFDGRRFALSRGEVINDIVLIKDFR
jgi:eukaryotic-like serine/threonine-protein kinase